jgi:hypothetical protein
MPTSKRKKKRPEINNWMINLKKQEQTKPQISRKNNEDKKSNKWNGVWIYKSQWNKVGSLKIKKIYKPVLRQMKRKRPK